MVDVSYEFYKDEFGGILPEKQFNKLLNRAFVNIDAVTFGRVSKISDSFDDYTSNCVRMCACALVESINSHLDDNGVEQTFVKSSETVGPWSVSYATGSQGAKSRGNSEIYKNICELYLTNTNLMCAWV